MLLFYQSDISELKIQDTFTLNEDDSRHCAKVLRKNVKDVVHIVDGKGVLLLAELTNVHDKKCQLKVLSKSEDFQARQQYLHIAIAPTKNADRIEYFIEKCVEIGIDEITLLETQHSERRNQKTERLEKIAISAMKQSLKAYLPKINPLVKFKDFILQTNDEKKLLAHLDDAAVPLIKQKTIESKYLILIGPEGDFSKEEIVMAQEVGFQTVSLGNSRLRTETAGIVACSIINSFVDL